ASATAASPIFLRILSLLRGSISRKPDRWKAACRAGYDGRRPRKERMTDYWVSKLFYDLSQPDGPKAQYRADREAVLARYPLKPEVRQAVLADDVTALARLVNPYLLRYYFSL